MTRIAGTNISTNADSAAQYLSVERINPSNHDEIEAQVTEWAEYNWANSAYWIIPNVMQAIISERDAKFLVPIRSYDGPTGEIETITTNVVTY